LEVDNTSVPLAEIRIAGVIIAPRTSVAVAISGMPFHIMGSKVLDLAIEGRAR
jgi:hypothetical protein